MINQRIFSANVGDSSVGIAGPDAIEQDIDNLLANDQELLGTLNDHETQINDLDANKAPNSHASTETTYGLGSTNNYGHVKTINALTQTSHVNGTALSAYQGKLLKDMIDGVGFVTGTYTGNSATNRTISLGFTPKVVIIVPISSSISGTCLTIEGSFWGPNKVEIITNGFKLIDKAMNLSGEYNYIACR
jgi:hypothetical protein